MSKEHLVSIVLNTRTGEGKLFDEKNKHDLIHWLKGGLLRNVMLPIESDASLYMISMVLFSCYKGVFKSQYHFRVPEEMIHVVVETATNMPYLFAEQYGREVQKGPPAWHVTPEAVLFPERDGRKDNREDLEGSPPF